MKARTLVFFALALAAVVIWLAARPSDPALESLSGPALEAPIAQPPSEDLKPALPAPAVQAPQAQLAFEPSVSQPEPSNRRAQEFEPELVVLYEHATHDSSFPGAAWKLALGMTDAGFVFRNDDASAVRVPDGLAVTLYEHPAALGARMTIGPGLHNLAPHGFNDRVSSVRVERLDERGLSSNGLLLYRDVPPEGFDAVGDWVLTLPRDQRKILFTVGNGDFDAGAVSALFVPPDHEVMLYEQPDGAGLAMVFGPGYHELEPVGFNDRTASIRLSRTTKR